MTPFRRDVLSLLILWVCSLAVIWFMMPEMSARDAIAVLSLWSLGILYGITAHAVFREGSK
jgi:hypothetical protein